MRAFIAVPIAPSRDLPEVVEYLRQFRNLKVPKNDIMHLTLSFLGEIDGDLKDKLCNRLSNLSFGKFSMELRELGAFPGEGKARVVFAGTDSTEIVELYERIAGIIPKSMIDDRKFVPHLTLARARSPTSISEIKKKFEKADLGKYEVEKVCLYRSVLRPEGPEYTEICCAQLI